jgi:undecaprenyl-diphosphatase
LTEFLPISSSGHLVVLQEWLGFEKPELLFDAALHLGTLIAVVVYFRRDLNDILRGLTGVEDLRDPARHTLLLIVVGSIPAVVAGLLVALFLEEMFSSTALVGVTLMLTGLALHSVRRCALEGGRGMEEMTVRDALLVGIAQAAAIVPGLSRSGLTISAALLLGVERTAAARFSFLLAIPAILGANALEVVLQYHRNDIGAATFILGILVSAAVGYLALRILIGALLRGRFHSFAWYLWPLGVLLLVRSLLT